MSIQVKFRRGTSTQHNSFTGANGEITVDTTNKTLRVHDGVTTGGVRLAKIDDVSVYLQVSNASVSFATKAYAAANSYVKSVLANTNSRINLLNTNLTGTNTAVRVLISDRLQVANATTLLAAKAPWSGITSTNTALRILISDRLQVANAATTYQTKATERAALANTNAYIATKAPWSGITSTNTALRTLISDRIQVANATTLLAAKATWTALTGTNTALRTLISDRYQVANVNTLLAAKATWAALTGTNTAIRTLVSDRYQVANVNNNFLRKSGAVPQTIDPNVAFSANVSIQGKLTVYGGVQTYSANNLTVSDNMIYLNSGSTASNPDLGFAGNYNDGVYHHAGFFRDASDAGTWKVFENYGLEPDANTFINTAHATFKLAPLSARDARFTGVLSVTANTTVGNTTVGGFLKLNGTDIRATFAQNTYVKTTLANTNLRVNLINTNLTGTNTALRTLISDRMQVANVKSILANTNAYIATKVSTTTFNLALANTNAYIASVVSGGGGASWSALTSTNTALRLLIADRYQVANVNTLLTAKATWAALTSTNTAIRAYVDDHLQVANAVTLYTTKSNPTTSGVFAHTGRATISTNIAVTGNTTITGALINLNNPVTVTTNAGTVSASYRVSTFTNSSAAGMTITMSTTGAIDGQMTMVRIYDFSAAAQTITWVNTENSIVTAPTTSNASTTLPLTVGFMYNGQTSKWRCIASA
jgi:hypothetical protein